MYSEHAGLLMERFPRLGLLAGTWEALEPVYEVLGEVALQGVELLYVYGIGDGRVYEQLSAWLHEEKKRQLVFLEDEPGYLAFLLEQEGTKKLLSDEQVFIELFSSGRLRAKELTAIAEKFPIRKVEVLALPSRSTRRFRSLRLTLLRKTTLAHGIHLDRLHGYQPFQNFVQNLKHLPRSFYANGMKGTFPKVPAIVCGAGPSLQAAIPLLRKYQDQLLIMGGGSTLAALSSQGIIPHFGMAIDPNIEEYLRFQNSFAFETPLLYSTRVFPQIFQTCNGPFGYMRTGIGGMMELWIEEVLGLKERLLGDHLTGETMSVTAICLAWAQFLGADPIFLSGVDLAYTDQKRYSPGVAEEVPFAQLQTEKGASDHLYKRKDRLGRPVYTAVRWVMESNCLSHFAKKHPKTTFINTSEGGIGFKHIPYQPLEEVLARYCTQKLDLEQRVHEKIFASPMPAHAAETIHSKMEELKQSLDRIIGHLEILAKDTSEGRRALAELDLLEEMAYPYLFYDAQKLFGDKEEKWELFYNQARRYRLMFEKGPAFAAKAANNPKEE